MAVKKEKNRLDLRSEAFKKIERMHPHKVLLFVSMTGSALVFLFMIIAFSASQAPQSSVTEFLFPKPFVLSTILLLLSSFTISKVLPVYKEGNLESVKKWLGITFLLGLAFGGSQLVGWRSLTQSPELFYGQSSGVYLSVISGLHVVHMIGIMIFLVYLLLECHKISKDSVQKLVYETNPYQKVKFEMLTDFWHFIDVLWMAVFIYFYFMF